MDMRKYSAGVIKPEDLHDGPRQEKIVNVFEHEKHGCAVLQFESGDQLYCWNNYARILSKAWGYDSENWLDQELELSLGHYTDKKTDTEKETVDIARSRRQSRERLTRASRVRRSRQAAPHHRAMPWTTNSVLN